MSYPSTSFAGRGAAPALFRSHKSSRGEGLGHRIIPARVFLLGLFKPGIELVFAHDPDRDRHERVVLAAKFRTLPVIDPFPRGLEPGLVQPSRNGVDLDAERRH